MPELRVFYDLISQPCRAVVLFLEANKIPYESVLISFEEGTSTVLCVLCVVIVSPEVSPALAGSEELAKLL